MNYEYIVSYYRTFDPVRCLISIQECSSGKLVVLQTRRIIEKKLSYDFLVRFLTRTFLGRNILYFCNIGEALDRFSGHRVYYKYRVKNKKEKGN